jgi:hypothetical protein
MSTPGKFDTWLMSQRLSSAEKPASEMDTIFLKEGSGIKPASNPRRFIH